MKNLILATAAIMSLASAGTALAARPQAKLPELAASGKPEPRSNAPSTNYALNGLPLLDTAQRGTQLAAGGGSHPQAETDQRGTQLAASGLDYVRQSHGQYA